MLTAQGGWLMLADALIESTKSDQAQPLLKQALTYNKVHLSLLDQQ